MILLVIGFVSLLFPNNLRFKYIFSEGQSWQYEDLTAPFDFAILKPENEIVTEKALIAKEFSPYYIKDLSVVKTQRRAFEEAFDQQMEMVKNSTQFEDVLQQPATYLDYGHQYLEQLYQRGVIELSDADQNKNKDFVINIIQGNTTSPQTLQGLYTITTATNLLQDTLPYSNLAEPEFLLPILENRIVSNITYNDTLTQRFQQEQLAAVSSTRGLVRKGELIIPKNGIITNEILRKLISFREQYQKEVTEQRSYLGVFLGYLLLATLIIGVFMTYLAIYATEIFKSFVKLAFVLLWIVVYSYLVYAVENINDVSIFLIPFCIVPIVIKNFYNDRIAIFTHIIVVLLASFLSSAGYEFTFLTILAGIVGVMSTVDSRDWTRFFYSMGAIFLTYALGHLGLHLIREGVILSMDYSIYTWFFLNVFLSLLAYPLIPLLERLFGFTSVISLVELSDMNRPLMRELSNKAPGTFQHSLQVGNLAEAAANEIGADPLLCKVAAMYHDIGKTLHPQFFIENQNAKNPHEDLTPLESATMILSHVTEGVALAKKYRLPKLIIDFIRTHHGTTRVEYFYRTYAKAHADEVIDEKLFTYAGPKPRSKEESILMLADSVEAACKSLTAPTEQSISQLIDKVITGKLQQQQLSDSEMTFEELEKCRTIFKTMLKSIHHARIVYPDNK